MTFRDVPEFRSAEPTRTDLKRLQLAVKTAFSELADEYDAFPKYVYTRTSVSVAFGEVLEVEETCTVSLPPIEAQDKGKRVELLVGSSITVTVRSPGGALINGSASDSLATAGRRVYVAGKTNWYR